jgi:hypothetical protein
MIRLNIPDASDEQALEAYVASLNRSAREGARRMILEGAAEADIVAYVEGFEERVADEEEAIYEEENAPDQATAG